MRTSLRNVRKYLEIANVSKKILDYYLETSDNLLNVCLMDLNIIKTIVLLGYNGICQLEIPENARKPQKNILFVKASTFRSLKHPHPFDPQKRYPPHPSSLSSAFILF